MGFLAHDRKVTLPNMHLREINCLKCKIPAISFCHMADHSKLRSYRSISVISEADLSIELKRI